MNKLFIIYIIILLSSCTNFKAKNIKPEKNILTNLIVVQDLNFLEALLEKGLNKKIIRYGAVYKRAHSIHNRLCKTNFFKVCPNMIIVDSKIVASPKSTIATIVITSGTVNKIASDDQLAFILGHELSHIIYGHTNKMTNNQVSENLKQTLNSTGLTEFFDDPGFPGIFDPTWFAMTLTTSLSRDVEKFLYRFDQNMEYQADILSINFLRKAKYNPRASIIFWKNAKLIFGNEAIYNGFAHNMYNADPITIEKTHPSYNNRLVRLSNYLKNKP